MTGPSGEKGGSLPVPSRLVLRLPSGETIFAKVIGGQWHEDLQKTTYEIELCGEFRRRRLLAALEESDETHGP